MEPPVTPAEVVLPDAGRRKLAGAYYTPAPLVDMAVEAALGPMAAARTTGELQALRILDPACGSGAFLQGAARFLRRLPWGRDGAAISRMLHGVDVDPRALSACEAGLRTAALAPPPGKLRRADWLLADPGGPWDLIVGNPPWVGCRSLPAARKAELAARFDSARGQFDLFGCFLEGAARCLAPGGRASLIVPDRWLLNPDLEPLRRTLLALVSLESVVRLGQGDFPSVQMPAASVVLRPGAAAGEVEVREGPGGAVRRLSAARFAAWPEARLPLHLGSRELERAAGLLGSAPALGACVSHGRGVELGKRSALVTREPVPGSAPIRFGEDVDRYILHPPRHIRLGVEGVAYKSPSLHAGPKVLLRKTGHGLRAALDPSDTLVSQVVYVLQPSPGGPSAAYLVGALCSATMGFLHRARNGEADKQAFPHLRQTDVLALPLPRPGASSEARVSALVESRMACRPGAKAQALEAELDSLIAAAYGGATRSKKARKPPR